MPAIENRKTDAKAEARIKKPEAKTKKAKAKKRKRRVSLERVPSVSSEFAGAELGDERRTKRLLSIADAVSAAPDRSLPQIARSAAELEATYRFLSNDSFGFAEVVEPHFKETSERAALGATTLVIHDASECDYAHEEHLREGLARFGNRQGFIIMTSLAVAGDGSNRPLGLLGCEPWNSPPKKIGKSKKKKKKARESRTGPASKTSSWGRIEGKLWLRSVTNTEDRLGGRSRAIHVMDREADGYELLSDLQSGLKSFVIRVMKNRNVELLQEELEAPGEFLNITEAVKRVETVLEIDAPVSGRRVKKGLKAGHPNRKQRIARLSYGAVKVRLKKSWAIANEDVPKCLDVNLVFVKEVDTPENEEPIEWLIFTSEAITTAAEIKRVVEIYQARWLIEELFKALKTGCSYEKRQLESYDPLLKLLAISLVVAWRSLALRQECRARPNAPATGVMSELHLEVLRATGRVPLPKNPTACEALRAVAALGGHIKNNGEPGWLVLCRGMECLEDRVVTWKARDAWEARKKGSRKCDR